MEGRGRGLGAEPATHPGAPNPAFAAAADLQPPLSEGAHAADFGTAGGGLLQQPTRAWLEPSPDAPAQLLLAAPEDSSRDAASALASLKPPDALAQPDGMAPPQPLVRIPGMGRGTSLYRGVSKSGDKKKWRAMIQVQKEQHHVGYYDTAEEAARAYDREALKHLGPHALINFPASDYANVMHTDAGQAGDGEPPRKAAKSSVFRGVSKNGRKWRANIKIGGRRRELGYFETPEEAARAYDVAAVEAYGLAARTNSDVREVMAAMGLPSDQQPLPLTSGADPSSAGAAADPQTALAYRGMTAGGLLRGEQAGSRYTGVSSDGNKWRAQVVVDLGRYESEAEAARAYDRAAVWCMGLTAHTNFPTHDWVFKSGVESAEPPGAALPPSPGGSEGPETLHPSPDPNAAQLGDAVAAEADAAETLNPAPSVVGGTDGDAAASAMEEGADGAGPESISMQSLLAEATGTRPAAADTQSGAKPSAKPRLSRYQGLAKKFNKWKALIKVHGHRKEISSFNTEEEAAACYDKHAVLAWGVRARTNFNILGLICDPPRDARLIADVMATGLQRSRSAAKRPASGAIAAVVSEGLARLPATSGIGEYGSVAQHTALAIQLATQPPRKSRFRGVTANWSKWRAIIFVQGKRRELGNFDTEEEAARAYDVATIGLYGPDKAKTNFPVADYVERAPTYTGMQQVLAAEGEALQPMPEAGSVLPTDVHT